MAKQRVTRKRAATAASKTLSRKSAGAKSKTAGGSALSQRKAPNKVTSGKAASASSQVLCDGRTSKASKSAAGSALSQRTIKSSKKAGTVSRRTVRKVLRKR